jgi:hypothetical protein
MNSQSARLASSLLLIASGCLFAQAPRSIGPASTGGRIADFAVANLPGKAEVMYVGTASGGVFKSANAGVSWSPIFDHAGAMMSIGAVAVAPSNPNEVWVGTGEVDNRQSSSWGDGIYKSLDGGATWHGMGLEPTRHIAKIIVDPNNANVVYVAALGHLWGSNPERGVYKTTDGGLTWKLVLFHDDNTGATDLAMSPTDPNVVYAALYQRQRKGWGYNGGGPGSGIYRTNDGGATWKQLTVGLPAGDKGRIGLATSPQNSSLVYAIVEADPPAGRGGAGGAAPAPGGPGGRGARAGAGAGPPPARGGVFRSLDQGETWEHLSPLNPRPSYYSRIYVDPRDSQRVYIMGSERGFYISDDGARNFRDVFSHVHGEDHVLWIDPSDPNHLLIGGDGGVSISYDRGETWLFRNDMPIGQFYAISTSFGPAPYLICGGLQDNGNWCTPSASHLSVGLSNGDSFNIGGGDGMYASFDGNDQTLLVSSQNGNTNRLTLRSFQRQSITVSSPAAVSPKPGEPALRWYWTAPIVVSHFSPQVIYTAANRLFRSPDQGRTWQPISPDLTAQINRDQLTMMGAPIPAHAFSKNDGQDNFSAITTLAESPLDAKLLYTGADDGTLQVTRDGGAHWTNVTHNLTGLPPMSNVSSIVASQYSASRVYATFDAHFNDDYHPYVFESDDYGATWRAIASGLPESSVHRLRENPDHEDFLVAGLEDGVYCSRDRGQHWEVLDPDMPPMPVYDLVYQASTHDLVLGTHGRGIWVFDHFGAQAALTPAMLSGPAQLLPTPPAHRETIYTPQAWYGAGEFFAPNPASGADISFVLPPTASGEATVSVNDSAGQLVRDFHVTAKPGLNHVMWDLHYNQAGPTAAPGRYAVKLAVGAAPAVTGSFEIVPDPASTLSPADAARRQTELMAAYRLALDLAPAREAANLAIEQLTALRPFAADAAAAVAQLTPAAGELARLTAQASSLQRAMDGYEGLPTAQQSEQLATLRQQAHAAVLDLNLRLAAIHIAPQWHAPPPLNVPASGSL